MWDKDRSNAIIRNMLVVDFFFILCSVNEKTFRLHL